MTIYYTSSNNEQVKTENVTKITISDGRLFIIKDIASKVEIPIMDTIIIEE